jgi:hypothetical protein
MRSSKAFRTKFLFFFALPGVPVRDNQDRVKRRGLCALAGALQRRYRDDWFFSHGSATKDQPAFCAPEGRSSCERKIWLPPGEAEAAVKRGNGRIREAGVPVPTLTAEAEAELPTLPCPGMGLLEGRVDVPRPTSLPSRRRPGHPLP